MGRIAFAGAALVALLGCTPVEEAGGPAALPTADAPTTPIPPGSSEWSYRAGGTEPFWTFNVASGASRWVLSRLGEPDVTGELTSTRRNDDVPTLSGRSAGGEPLTLRAVAEMCSDGMSDRCFAHTVTLRLGPTTFRGCGGAILRPSEMMGTRWSVESLDGRTVGSPDAVLAFTGEGLSASVGCNRYRKPGRWSAPDRFVGEPAAGTRMACGPLADADAALARLLAGEVKAAFRPDGTLRLSGGGVRAVLKRVI